MIVLLVELVSGMVATGAAAAAIITRPTDQATETHAQRAGAAGEKRVARALERAGVPAIHDITLQDRRGTHQIDHVAAAGDCLYCLETKTWRGELMGHAHAQQWTLKKPDGAAQRVYNPLLQNETHRDVIRRVTQVPVRPLVILAGHVQLAGEPVPGMISLTSAIMEMTRAGAASGRALAALEALERFRGQSRQAVLSAAHRRRMRRHKPACTRQLWILAVGAALVFFVLAGEQAILW
ncbi:nuclease-related domain-containing protein [Acidiphilium cryptum]|nr:nuclease-related domain-containing protein [Acidiphilium cryptum]